MGISMFFNIHANKWEVRFRGKIWQFGTKEEADEKVIELKNQYFINQ